MMSKVLLVAFVAVLSAGEAGAWEIQLTVDPVKGPEGVRPVTVGVPLHAGQAKEPAELRLAGKDPNGQWTPIPAQVRVMARWWRQDNSIRWVLVDYAARVEKGTVAPVYLTNAAVENPKPAPALAVEQTADTIVVTTGPARFVVNRKRFNAIEKAFIDANGDGRFDESECVLATPPDGGTVLEDTYGEKYFGSDGTASVEVTNSGPLQVTVRARGRHLAREGRGYAPGMYGYDVFLNFYAGSSDVFADVIITNNPPKSIGSPTFEDASLVLRLAGGAKHYELLCDDEAVRAIVPREPAPGRPAPAPPEPRLSSRPVVAGDLAAGESVCLYQDSNGAFTWADCPGLGHMASDGWHRLKDQKTSFRGYQAYRRRAAAERTTTQPVGCGEVVAQGNQARGVLHLTGERGGVIVHTKHFWQQFPKAVEAFSDGTVRVGLFPREWKAVHFLEDTAAKGHEVVLSFHGPEVPAGAAERVADAWDNRLYPRPTLEHMAACGALADLGPYTPPTLGLDKKPDTRTVAQGPRMFETDKLYGNAFGWQVFGDRWRSNGGHGRRGARQPIDEDNYLYRWYVTGLPEWFAAGDARSRHFRDVRIYRVDPDRQDPFGFPSWKEFRAANRNEDWTNRPQPKGEEIAKYTQGIYPRSDWPFPNPEHTTLDLLYDRYLLMGDERCLENMRIAAAHGGYFSGRGGSALSGGWPWRANGWGWRTLFRYWDLTGDKAAAACLEDVLKTHAAHIGKVPLVSHHDIRTDEINWWFTNIYCRAVAMTALHTGDQRALDLLKTLAQGKEKNARQVPTLFAVLYHLTGEEPYKTAVLGTDDGAGLRNVGGYFPACDHWLVQQPPKPRK